MANLWSSLSSLEIFGLWFVGGLLCSLVWPLVFRRCMKNHWLEFFKMWPVFGLFGPIALVASFPV